jgi:hypothetical protein
MAGLQRASLLVLRIATWTPSLSTHSYSMSTTGTNRRVLVKSFVTTLLSWSPLGFTKFAIRQHYQSQPTLLHLISDRCVVSRSPRLLKYSKSRQSAKSSLTRASVHIAVCFSISLLSIVLYNVFTVLLYLFTVFRKSSRFSKPFSLRFIECG